MVPVGAVLAGKYRVERVLGQGGMGVVVQATHLQLGQAVAVKFLLPEVLSNHDIVHRFLREAQAAVRLKSEHVARVIDVGTLETGAPYMVLEYLDGTDLAHVSRAHLTPGMVVDLILQACEALAEAHAIGIIHRDIKPANFFVTRRSDGSPVLKVLDFGISKAPVGAEGNLTATQSVMGTPAYMSPEQMRSAKGADARSDIWSLGAVLYELLQGTQPFEADSFSAMCLKVAMEPMGPLTVPLPPGLADIVYRCLEKDPQHRFQNVAELAAALAPFAATHTQAIVSVERAARTLGTQWPPLGTAPGTFVPSTLSGSAGPRSSPGTGASGGSSAKRWPIVAAVGAVVVGGVIVAAVLAGGGGSSAKEPSAATTTTPDTISVDAAAVAETPTTAVTTDAADVATAPLDAGIDATAVTAIAPTAEIDAGTTRRGHGSRHGGGTRGSAGSSSSSGGDDDVLGTRN
jgi:serine/threonine protein kinase